MSENVKSQDEPGFLSKVLEGIGEPFVFVGREILNTLRIFVLVLFYTIRRPIRWSEVWRQMYEVGNRSFLFIVVVLGFLGMILVYQSGFQAERIVGDLQMLGALYLQMLFREFAPTITALMLATRVGTGIAAQIGSMVVTEQVDALRMSGADPVQYLVVPRFLATSVMMVVLACVALVTAYLTGMMVGQLVFDINPRTFFNVSFIEWGDLIVFLMKSVAYGITIPIIAAESGLSAFGGSEGVGWATTKSVVNASLSITVIDFALSGFGYLFLF